MPNLDLPEHPVVARLDPLSRRCPRDPEPPTTLHRHLRGDDMPKRLDDLHLGIKRFLNPDTAALRDGVIDSRTKALLGLVAFVILRGNACMDYHLIQCAKAGRTDAEL